MLVYSWGKGEGTLPHLMERAPRNTKDLAFGEDHTLLLTEFGELYGWGRDREGQVGDMGYWENEYIVGIACGSKHSAAINIKGELFLWGLLLPLHNELDVPGRGGFRELRQGMGWDRRRNDTRLSNIVLRSELAYLQAAGEEEAQLGEGDVFLSSELTRIRVLDPRKEDLPEVVQVACGYAHTVALTIDGEIYASGYNEEGQLGVSHRRPTARFVKLRLKDVVKVACGSSHSVALTRDGHVYVWGQGTFGQLGIGRKGALSPEKVIFPEVDGRCVDISCGDFHSVVLLEGGLYAFGHKDAVPGESHITRRACKMKLGESDKPDRLYCGGQTSFIVCNDQCFSWGYNQKHQLGRPCLTRGENVPKAVRLPTNYVFKIAIGMNKAAALVQNLSFTGLVASLMNREDGLDGNFGNLRIHSAIFDVRCPRWRECTEELEAMMPLLKCFRQWVYTDYTSEVFAAAKVADVLGVKIDRTREETGGWVKEGNGWIMRTEPPEDHNKSASSTYYQDIMKLITETPKADTDAVEIVVAADRSIFLDRFLLSSLTVYFQAMMSGGFMESTNPRIDLSRSIRNADAFIEMIAQILIGEPTEGMDNFDTFDLLCVAHQFEAHFVRGYAEKRLLEEVPWQELRDMGDLCQKIKIHV